MNILGQKRDVLVNFDNIIVLAITNVDEYGKIYVQENKFQIVLGEYKTNERAKEVFNDIIKASTNSDVAVYKMPEK